MRTRFALLALLATLALGVAGCGGDPPPTPGAGAPSTTADTRPDQAATPTTRTETTRPIPRDVIPAGEREPAPDIQVTDFDGRTITLGGFRGQPVVVNFFESW
jgi:cytochrome oxidase Cu insertion factor (SCO1/SenC/PrrC family)